MRRLIIGAIALALGCATGGQEQRSDTIAAQDQAQKELQQAADAQKRAADEQARAEQAARDVAQAQKTLANAQARLRGQRARAEQAQMDAQRMTQEANQRAADAQEQAMQNQRLQAQRTQQLEQGRQNWIQPRDVSGSVVEANESQVALRTRDSQTLRLDLTDNTAVRVDGQLSSAAQLRPGEDVRASYQMIDGHAKALQIDATSNQQQQNGGQQDLNTPPPPQQQNPMR